MKLHPFLVLQVSRLHTVQLMANLEEEAERGRDTFADGEAFDAE